MMMRFIDDKIKVICEELHKEMKTKLCDITEISYAPAGYKADEGMVDASAFTPFDPHLTIGGRDRHYWFSFSLDTPVVCEGKKLFLTLTTGKEGQWDATNPQAILYLDGHMVQGMDTNHTEALIEGGRHYEALVYFYIGIHEDLVAFRPALVEVDTEIEALYYDFKVALDAAMTQDGNDANRIEILKRLEAAEKFLDLREPYSEAFYAGIRAARTYLKEELYENKALCGKTDATVSTIGHTHIDVAWLWTLAQTREKAQRSFSTVLALQKEYPEYIFMSSQPQLYDYVKKDAPALYEEIKKAVAEGRWEVEGAMWLEADCNLSSGESLIRQIIHGKRFMKEEFNAESHILWLPDVFGYSVALPQILKKTGVDTFVTSKISWNETNKMPYDAFQWRGLDGSEVFTYFLTAKDHDPNDKGYYTTYVGYIRPSQVLGTYERFQNKEYNKDTIITFGFGDGGGGPTRDMLEQQRRLASGLPGLPATKMEKAGDFLARVKEHFDENCALLGRTPRWSGELYLEYHRGTYTSIAKNKRNNRKSEFLFENAEKLSATDLVLLGGSYPDKEIYDAWQTILLNQFHDIIPGSSIFEVYEDCDKQYAALKKLGNSILDEKLKAIASHVAGKGTLVYNPTGYKATSTVKIDGVSRTVSDIPAFGWKVVAPAAAKGLTRVEGHTAENDFFRMTLDEEGNMILFDKKNQRSVFAEGQTGNVIEAFEDFPRAYDDWELTNYYKQKKWKTELVSVEPVFDGDRAGFFVKRTFSHSTIEQKIWLYDAIAKIDVENTLDWHDHHVVLKAAFPTDVNTNTVTCEVQFGSVERPTHQNTSWDAAKFEVCAQKWADLSDNGYGLSILNDCKYGYNAEGSTLKLTMLKCGTYPNPEADQGIHEFTYTIYPHAGALREADTVKESYLLNLPLLTVPCEGGDGKLASEYSFLSCDKENMVTETLKKAYDDKAVIFRSYESANKRTEATFTPGFACKKAYLCDMMENELFELPLVDGKLTVTVNPFEIVTLKLTF